MRDLFFPLSTVAGLFGILPICPENFAHSFSSVAKFITLSEKRKVEIFCNSGILISVEYPKREEG